MLGQGEIVDEEEIMEVKLNGKPNNSKKKHIKWKKWFLVISIFFIGIVSGFVQFGDTFFHLNPQFESEDEGNSFVMEGSLLPSMLGYTFTDNEGITFEFWDSGKVKYYYMDKNSGSVYLTFQGETAELDVSSKPRDYVWIWDNSTELEERECNEGEITPDEKCYYKIIVFKGYNNNENLNITQVWKFHEVKSMKFSYYITSNYNENISNVNYNFVIDTQNQMINLVNRIVMDDLEFRYQDVIDSGFNVVPSLTDNNGITITTDDGSIKPNETIILDPTITAYKLPTITGTPLDQWVDGENLTTEDNLFTSANVTGLKEDTSNYTFLDITRPINLTVHGIQCQIEGYSAGECSRFIKALSNVGLNLSWDGGTSYTSSIDNYFTCSNPLVQPPEQDLMTYGSLTNKWGHNWTFDELNDTNFRAKLTNLDFENNGVSMMDYIQCRINYTEFCSDPPVVILDTPPNESVIESNNIYMNFTVTDIDNNLIETYLYGSNNTEYLNQSLLMRNTSIRNDTTLDYNWTGVIVYPNYSEDIFSIYHLDNLEEFGESSSFVIDFSGNLRNLTVVGDSTPKEYEGHFGGAYEFYGNDDLVLPLGSGETTLCDNGCSFSGWFNTENIGSQIVLARYGSEGDDKFLKLTTASWGMLFDIGLNGNDTEHCYVYSGANMFDSGNWTQFTATYNDNSMETKIYINGSLMNTTTCEWGINKTAWDDDETFKIGDDSSLTSGFEGIIDEVVIWNRTLTDDEVYDLYNLKNDKYYWMVKAVDCNGSSSKMYEFNISVITDTCTYTSGNWNVDFFDNCTLIDQDITLCDGCNLSVTELTGTGFFLMDNTTIRNIHERFISGGIEFIRKNGARLLFGY